MSRVFREKNKDLVNLEVVNSDKVWKKVGNKYVLNKNKYDIFGKIDKGSSAFITATNLSGNNTKFIEDTCKLSKKNKNEIVKKFSDENKKVVYLVKLKYIIQKKIREL